MKVSGILAEKGLHALDHDVPTEGGVRFPRVWLVVTDRKEAYVYRKMLRKVEQIAHLKPGHGHDDAQGKGSLPHGHDARSEKHHHADSAFLQKLAAWIDKAAGEEAFDRFVVAAPPHTLGDMRHFLGAASQARLAAEINKDWIKLSQKEIEEHLSGMTGL